MPAPDRTVTDTFMPAGRTRGRRGLSRGLAGLLLGRARGTQPAECSVWFGRRWDLVRRTGLALALSIGMVAPVGAYLPSAVAATPTVVNDPGWMPNVAVQIGANQLWKNGATGNGIEVALIDTGVAPVTGLTSGNMLAGPDLSTTAGVDGMYGMDAYGHGTFLAGIIAGRDDGVTPGSEGAINAGSGTFLGVAPDASLVSVKVGGPDGSVDPSQVIAALDWVAAHHADPGANIRVVNLSYGTGSTQSSQVDPLAAAVERVWKAGVVVTVAAGNDGQQNALLNDPAIDPYVIAVGANGTYGSDGSKLFITSFTNSGNYGRHVDVVAPGSSIVSLRDPGSYVDVFNPQGMVPVDNSDRFFRGSGTSEATAVVSGVVAVLLQKYPSLTPDMVKNILMASATPLYGATAGMVGAGSLDAAAAGSLAANVVKAGGQVPSGDAGQSLRNLPDHGGPQAYPVSDGTGSLDATRAGATVQVNGVPVTGQDTIFGVAYDPTRLGPDSPLNQASWGGGTWTGRAWSGRAWSGRAWSGQAWQGDAWTGRAWSSDTWDGRAWSSGGWDGRAWSSALWSSTDWSGRAWSGNNWGQPASRVKFSGPSGVAVDPAGNVWIADTGNNQVDKFNPAGVQLRILATTGNGSGNHNGLLAAPQDLATDRAGNVYVADTGNNQVEQFSPNGTLIKVFTANGLVTNGVPGKLKNPSGVAVDAAGNAYIADTGDNRVVELAPDGSFVRAFTQSGISGNNGALNGPQGVAIDQAGNVYVADTGNNRVEQYNTAGALVAAFTTNANPALGNPAMNKPTSVAVDAAGNLWVADSGNHQIEKFAAGTQAQTAWTTIGAGPLGAPNAVAVDQAGNVYIADGQTSQVAEAGPNGVLKATFGISSSTAALLNGPQGAAIDANGSLWVADTGNNQIVISAGPGIYLTAITSNGTAGGLMSKPEDLAFTPEGDLWVADTGNNRVEKFSHNGQFLTMITTNGLDPATTGHIALNAPSAVAVDAVGNVYVADTGNNRVEKYDPDGTFLRAFTFNGFGTGSSNAQLSQPSGVAVDAAGNVYISDTGHNRIAEFTASGASLAAWDKSGTPASLFMKSPAGITLDGNGNLWVADTGNNQLDQLDPRTDTVIGWTNNANGVGTGRMNHPSDVVIDAANNVFVADTGNSQIDQFSANNVVLSTINANHGLSKPQTTAMDSQGNLFVADTGGNRVVEYGPSGDYRRSFNFTGPTATGDGLIKGPKGIAIDPAGNTWVADTGNNRIEEFTPDGQFIQALTASGLPAGQNQMLNQPQGIVFDPAGNLYVADTGNGTVEEFSPQSTLLRVITLSGLKDANGNPIPLKASAVDVDAAGNIYAADTANKRVAEYNTKGALVRAFTATGLAGVSMSAPQGVLVDSSGNVYVADTDNNQIEKYAPTGKLLKTFTASAPKPDGTPMLLNHPAGLSLDPQNRILIADSGNNRFVDLAGNPIAPTSPAH